MRHFIDKPALDRDNSVAPKKIVVFMFTISQYSPQSERVRKYSSAYPKKIYKNENIKGNYWNENSRVLTIINHKCDALAQ